MYKYMQMVKNKLKKQESKAGCFICTHVFCYGLVLLFQQQKDLPWYVKHKVYY